MLHHKYCVVFWGLDHSFYLLMNHFTSKFLHCPKLFITVYTKHSQFIHYSDFFDLLRCIMNIL